MEENVLRRGCQKLSGRPLKGLAHPCSNSLNVRWYLLLIASGPVVLGYFFLFNDLLSSNMYDLEKEGHYLGLNADLGGCCSYVR